MAWASVRGRFVITMMRAQVLLARLILVGVLICPGRSWASSTVDEFKKDSSVGVRAAESLSQVTGMAISPLLGVGAMGAYKYYRTKPEERAKLTWYAQPWFWSAALAVVAVCMLKDSLGPAMPTTLKKPLDVLELFENKTSALIATGAIVPIAAEVFEVVKPHLTSQLDLAGLHFAASGIQVLGDAVMVPLSLLIYGAVWLVSHTINVLILVSPFTTVDTALKSFRAALLGSVAGTQALDHRLGAGWALVVVLVCFLLAPWAFRTVVYGTVFAWDLVSLRRRRFAPSSQGNWIFAARAVGQAPRRAMGRLVRKETGELAFIWKPWLVLPARTEALPPGRYAIGQGILYSEVLRIDAERTSDVFHWPPRCTGHEQALAELYGFEGLRPIGLRAAWVWLKSLFVPRPAEA